ncbi:MAG: acyl-CoA thioesterase [Bacteriovoracaceae bacterium]|jgi:acyl-CoA hydrolase|nr:acyl-CoA thioesterase [Bacteriovoracaceae bacterium]
MNLESRRESARTRLYKAVFPGETNHYDTLFGGMALNWMDEIAFIAATRFTRQKVVTVSTDKINFNTPIPTGSLVELDAKIGMVGNTSIEVIVDIYTEDMYSEKREKAVTGKFVLVAIDDNKKATKIKCLN